MKIKLDENIPIEAAQLLRGFGHNAMTVYEEGLSGHTDSAVLAVCHTEERILITLDLDFANVQLYPPENHDGIIVLRLLDQKTDCVLQALTRIVKLFQTEEVQNRLWIVEDKRVRIRS